MMESTVPETVVPEMSVRPKRQTQPPRYLEDYALGRVRRRSAPDLHNVAQHTDRPGEEGVGEEPSTDRRTNNLQNLLNMAARLSLPLSASSSIHDDYHDTVEDIEEKQLYSRPTMQVDNRPPCPVHQQVSLPARAFIPAEYEPRQRGVLHSIPAHVQSFPPTHQASSIEGRPYALSAQATAYAPVSSRPYMSTQQDPSAERARYAPADRAYNPVSYGRRPQELIAEQARHVSADRSYHAASKPVGREDAMMNQLERMMQELQTMKSYIESPSTHSSHHDQLQPPQSYPVQANLAAAGPYQYGSHPAPQLPVQSWSAYPLPPRATDSPPRVTASYP